MGRSIQQSYSPECKNLQTRIGRDNTIKFWLKLSAPTFLLLSTELKKTNQMELLPTTIDFVHSFKITITMPIIDSASLDLLLMFLQVMHFDWCGNWCALNRTGGRFASDEAEHSLQFTAGCVSNYPYTDSSVITFYEQMISLLRSHETAMRSYPPRHLQLCAESTHLLKEIAAIVSSFCLPAQTNNNAN